MRLNKLDVLGEQRGEEKKDKKLSISFLLRCSLVSSLTSELPSAMKDLRWLKKDFLTLPVQSIFAKIWDIREEEGHEFKTSRS